MAKTSKPWQCMVGLHRWDYESAKQRQCKKCDKRQFYVDYGFREADLDGSPRIAGWEDDDEV